MVKREFASNNLQCWWNLLLLKKKVNVVEVVTIGVLMLMFISDFVLHVLLIFVVIN
jgi:hypothetical protein